MVSASPGMPVDNAEQELRRDMAAVFRVGARLGWNEQIGNHISVMLPGEEPRFLINPRGYLFQELKASDLIVCDLAGRVHSGAGELRKVAMHIHARIHLRSPHATCVVHVHPQWSTALSLLAEGELTLAHHNNLLLNDRIVYDDLGNEPVTEDEEGDRIASLVGNRSVMIMRGHGLTVVGPTVHDAFDETYMTERTCMYQVTALQTGLKLHALPEGLRRRHNGPWGDRMDARLHLDAWRRILDREEPDYRT